MLNALFLLSIFFAKAIIIVVLILLLLAGVLNLFSRGKNRAKLSIKNLNDCYEDTKKTLLEEVLSKKEFKQFIKETKAAEKSQKNPMINHKKQLMIKPRKKNIFVIHFEGDMKASAVAALRERSHCDTQCSNLSR